MTVVCRNHDGVVDTCRRVDVAVCDDGMESLRPGGHASVTVLVGDGLFLEKELVYAACFARRPSLQVFHVDHIIVRFDQAVQLR